MACFSSNLIPWWLNVDRAPQLKAGVGRFPFLMKNIFCEIGISFFLLTISSHVAIAKEWRGIVPLMSNRVQVEQLLGVPRKSSQWSSYYNLSSEIAVIQFKSAACDIFVL
jgi:hypothetical protein